MYAPRNRLVDTMGPSLLARAPPTCECVAYITRTIEHGCKLGRLQMLVQTAGPRWVYVLHHRNHTPAESVVATLRPRERVRIQPQVEILPSSPWGLFGGKLVGYSKAAFVLWLVHNGSSCSRSWQIEDDVFYTGSWRSLFDAHVADNADLIALTAQQGDFVHEYKCFVFRNDTNVDQGSTCRSPAGRLTVTIWPLLRMSRRFATEIGRVLTEDGGKGFHEAFIAPVCERASWCRMSQLTRLGRLASGHSRYMGMPADARSTLEWQAALAVDPYASAVNRSQNPRPAGWPYNGTVQVPPERVFHPVKCEADATLGGKARRWVSGVKEKGVGCVV